MSLPREVIPGRFYIVTRRCTQRQFLLRPDEETNNAFLYCLAEAAQRCNIAVLLTCAMSNHHHTVIFDRDGNVPAFTEHFHKLVAKCQNALRGRWENLWAGEQVCVVRLVDPADVNLQYRILGRSSRRTAGVRPETWDHDHRDAPLVRLAAA